MEARQFRESLMARIMDMFSTREWVLAIWEGGSAATGFLDRLSDLDLVLLTEDHRAEDAFTLFEEMIEEHYGIKTRFRVPEPSWHGHSQAFYFLHRSPDHFYVDLLVEKRSSGNRMLETDRHGNPRIHLDREALLDPAPTPAEELAEKTEAFRRMQSSVIPISETETAKQLLRGNPVDAMLEYQGFVQRRLGALLNLKYRPAKYDFGVRYGDREYPPDTAARLARLMYAGSLEELKPRFDEAAEWAAELIEELNETHGGRS